MCCTRILLKYESTVQYVLRVPVLLVLYSIRCTGTVRQEGGEKWKSATTKSLRLVIASSRSMRIDVALGQAPAAQPRAEAATAAQHLVSPCEPGRSARPACSAHERLRAAVERVGGAP